jgi:lipoprotein NlpD
LLAHSAQEMARGPCWLAHCCWRLRVAAPHAGAGGRPQRGRARPPLASVAAPARPLPGAENAGKPGYYTVRPGDTLIRIALEHGQNWRDIVRWNAWTTRT